MAGTDVFISYAWSDGNDAAQTVRSILTDRRVSAAYFDRVNPASPGQLSTQMKDAIDAARVFLPVLTNDYFTNKTAQLEEQYARAIRKPFVPVVVGERDSVDLPERFADDVLIVISAFENHKATAIEELVRHTSPSDHIIDSVKKVAATGDMAAALKLLDQMKEQIHLVSEHRLHVEQYRATLLRLAGHRDEATKVIDELRVDGSYPYPILQKTLVTAALLRIDERKWADARLRLAEAMAILSKEDAWKKNQQLRRRLLAEVTREMARTYLSEALYEQNPDDVRYELEIAWSLYLEALALVTVEEDGLCHAWVQENLGVVALKYAQNAAEGNGGDGAPQFTNLDYPFIGRYRGDPHSLAVVGRRRLEDAVELFRDEVKDSDRRREGMAWARFHIVDNDLFQRSDDAAHRKALQDLTEVAKLFEGIPEGQGLVYKRLSDVAAKLGETDAEKSYLALADATLKRSQTHEDVQQELQKRLRQKET